VPGGLGAGEGNDWGYASSGIVEIHFNPEGRGALHRSEGVENHNGFVHQDDLRAVIEYADALPNRLAGATGVHTRSYGITMGAGCLGRYPELPVKYLLDIEGPDDSFVTSFEPWALDAVPGNDRHVAARNTFGHWSTYREIPRPPTWPGGPSARRCATSAPSAAPTCASKRSGTTRSRPTPPGRASITRRCGIPSSTPST